MKKDQFILGIETSCDETAAAVIKNGTEILSQCRGFTNRKP